MTYTEIEDLIKAQIRNNGEKAITGQVLQDVLLAMIAPHAQREHPFTLTALESGVFNLAKGDESYDQIALESRKNEGEWAVYEFGTPIACSAGDAIQLRGDNETMCYVDGDNQFPYWNWQGFSGSWKVSGNIMSLLYKESFARATSIPFAGGFMGLFSGRTGGFAQLVDASELVLPATTLAQSCYAYMFYGCTGLTYAPALPAIALTFNCYAYMFDGCRSLAAAPVLPATTLANNCYSYMFSNCPGLAFAPALPATMLAYGCYDSMFRSCTGLTAAPELPATTLERRCYYQMFQFCSNLAEVRCHATNIDATAALTNWLAGAANTGTFYKDASVTYPSGTEGIPAGWTIRNL